MTAGEPAPAPSLRPAPPRPRRSLVGAAQDVDRGAAALRLVAQLAEPRLEARLHLRELAAIELDNETRIESRDETSELPGARLTATAQPVEQRRQIDPNRPGKLCRLPCRRRKHPALQRRR